MPIWPWSKPVEPREATALCPECKSPDHLPIRPIMRSDALGEWAVGSIRECLNCRHRYAAVQGKVIKPQWMLDEEREREKAKDKAASLDSLRDRFRKDAIPVHREQDLKWPG